MSKHLKLQTHFKKNSSGYEPWSKKDPADEYVLYPDNITETLDIDEVCLSKGELYTIVTNKLEGAEF